MQMNTEEFQDKQIESNFYVLKKSTFSITRYSYVKEAYDR